MALNDPLANALSMIMQHEKLGRREILIKPKSTVITRVLDILNGHGYVGKYDVIDDGKGGHLKLNLLGNINKCGVIKPRFSIKLSDIEGNEKRYLPAKGFGILIMSTPLGLMTHIEAAEKKTGGVLIAYCY